tara:strand:- start:341 stop:511 length:171 start_codon:yes stop_codon:yes gene_type:complete
MVPLWAYLFDRNDEDRRRAIRDAQEQDEDKERRKGERQKQKPEGNGGVPHAVAAIR